MSEFKEAIDSAGKQSQELSPGLRLRHAREQSGLSRGEVAAHLKLNIEKIDSLERGEVDQLAAPVFVAGYLRAYAKLVGLPEDEIIADFKALSMMKAPSMDPSTSPAANNYGQMASSTVRKGIRSRGKDWSQIAIWGSVVIVLVVVLSVIFTGDETEISGKVDSRPAITEAAQIPAIEIGEVNAIEEKVESRVEDEITGQRTEEKPVPEPVAEPVNKINKGELAAISEPNRINEKNLNHSVIVFNFKEDSWIEVNDAIGKRLLFRLGKAGTSRTVWGAAPFNVQIGYIAGVDIIFNGEPYDLSRFANRRSAKFRLGQAGDRMNTN